MSAAVGVYGKFPGLGDFLRWNIPVSFVEAWDAWLQDGLSWLASQLGERWSEVYLNAPIWRFTLPAGSAGPQAMQGIIMPSVDRVGRHFPLTLAGVAPEGAPGSVHFANGDYFATLEQAALAALDDTATRDTLLGSLEPLVPSAPQSARLPVYSGSVPPEAVLAGDAIQGLRGGVWSSSLPGDHRLLLCNELPNHSELAALFDPASALWRVE